MQQGHTEYLLKTGADLLKFGPSFSGLVEKKKNKQEEEQKEGKIGSQKIEKKHRKAAGSEVAATSARVMLSYLLVWYILYTVTRSALFLETKCRLMSLV